MGIRIQGSNDTILATDGSWNAEGIDLSAGLNVGTAVTVSARGDIAITGIITASSFSGVTITTINNNADNRLITGSGTADTLNGEANLTFDGDNLAQTIDANGEGINLTATGNYYPEIEFNANRSAANNTLGYLNAKWNSTEVASISFNAGADTTNKDDAYITFNTASAGTNTERMRLDSAGRLIIGHTASTGQDRVLQVIGTTSDTSSIEAIRHSADTSAAALDFSKSRNASKGSNTIVSSGDQLGQIVFRGDDGTDLTTPAATIFAAVDGTPGANDMPGRLVFNTTPDGANAVVERLRIDSSGHTLPGADNTYDLGSYSKRWANVHSMDLNLSNEGSQNDVDGSWGSYTIQEGENDLFLLNRRNGKKYKFNLTEV